MAASELQQELISIVKQINREWSAGNPKNLDKYFHPDIIITGPDHNILGSGRDECVESYVEFTGRAADIDFEITSFDVRIWESTAYVRYEYDISWTDRGKRNSEKGRDIFFFTNADGKWLAVMRTILPGS